ncbi:MAG: response regulator [Cytophagales bacterium]|nr:response regulator [Cytophagales bacterium]
MPTPRTSVAIIDDDPVYQFTTKKIIELSKLAGTVSQFNSGDEALAFIERNCNGIEALPDIVLLDLNMPVTDGWMFLEGFRKIRGSLCKEVAIYLVTSSIDPRDIALSKTYPEVKEFISKPLDMEQIREILSSPV